MDSRKGLCNKKAACIFFLIFKLLNSVQSYNNPKKIIFSLFFPHHTSFIALLYFFYEMAPFLVSQKLQLIHIYSIWL